LTKLWEEKENTTFKFLQNINADGKEDKKKMCQTINTWKPSMVV